MANRSHRNASHQALDAKIKQGKAHSSEEGIDETKEEDTKRRCPFLLNILESLGALISTRSDMKLEKLLLIPGNSRENSQEPRQTTASWIQRFKEAWEAHSQLDPKDESIFKGLFGPAILADNYHLETHKTFIK